jgi:YHS domain-containing protein
MEMTRRTIAVAILLAVLATSMMVFAQVRKPEKAQDPVCKIMVDKDPNLSVNYRGEVYYFCSKADMEKFKQEPQKYVKSR